MFEKIDKKTNNHSSLRVRFYDPNKVIPEDKWYYFNCVRDLSDLCGCSDSTIYSRFNKTNKCGRTVITNKKFNEKVIIIEMEKLPYKINGLTIDKYMEIYIDIIIKELQITKDEAIKRFDNSF